MCIQGIVLSLVSRLTLWYWSRRFDRTMQVFSRRTICTTVVVSDWCITNLVHGWWVSIQSTVGIVWGRNWSPAVRCGGGRLSCCLIVGIQALGISIPLSLLMLLDTTLRSHLVRPKDPVDPRKQDGVVYKIPCECGKAYIGETGSWMYEQIKEHDRDIRLSRTQTSAVSEHANKTGHYPLWDKIKFIDWDSHWYSCRVKGLST